MDNRPAGLERKADDVVVGEYFMSYKEDFQTELQGKWIGFRGEDHTNIIKTTDGKPFLEGEFEQVWSFETGEGHAAPVIYNGRVYVLDYNEQLNSDALRCFSLETGEELWRRWYRVPMILAHDSRRGRGLCHNGRPAGTRYVLRSHNGRDEVDDGYAEAVRLGDSVLVHRPVSVCG